MLAALPLAHVISLSLLVPPARLTTLQPCYMPELLPSASTAPLVAARRRRATAARLGMTTVLAPLRMDARVWFANERTFLSWMNMSAILTTFAGGLTVIGEGYATQITGVLILTSSALIFILYAAYMHYHRARNLRKRRVTGFEDRFGTSLIFMVMTTAVLANLVVTLVHSFNRYEIDRFQYRSGVS